MKYFFTFIIGLAIGAFSMLWLEKSETTTKIEFQLDTLIIRDTIRITEPKYTNTEIVHYDTLYFPYIDNDTAKVTIPITQKEYKSEEYYALIEGYNPNLLQIDIYPKNIIITETITKTIKPRWSIGIQGGIGFNGKITPYIGIGIQYTLWNF